MKGRKISQAEKDYLMSLTVDDFIGEQYQNMLNYSLFTDLFGTKTTVDEKGKIKIEKPKFEPTDEFTLEPKDYPDVKEKLRTTVGQYVYNMVLFRKKLYTVVGYINKTLNAKGIGKVEEKLSSALMSDKITVDEFIEYVDNFQRLSIGAHHIIASSFTMRGLKPVPEIIKRKEQLFKQHAKEVEEGNVIVVANIEKTLVDEAEKILHDEPSLALYRSGARGSMENNYKNMSIMKGVVQDPATGKYDVIANSYIQGIGKRDISAAGNNVVQGTYPKSVGTAVGGYKFKEMSSALQAIVCDEPGTDCGSKGYIEVTMTPSNKHEYLYRYIIEGKKLVLLDNTNIDKYINKPVKMRDAMYCIGDKLCATCAGEQFNKLNIKSIGLASSKVGSTMVKLGMKTFHDNTVKLYDIDLNDITLD